MISVLVLGCCLELQADVLGEGFNEGVLGPSDKDRGWVSVMGDDVLEELGWSRWREDDWIRRGC